MLSMDHVGQVAPTEIKFSDVYAVELINYGVIHGPNVMVYGVIHGPNVSNARRCLKALRVNVTMSFQSSRTLPSVPVLARYTFGHKDLHICQIWVNQINASLDLEQGTPKNLLVFVHPRTGKGNACKTWDSVAPIFSRAKVKTKGGDGFFNNILNGFLSSRHKAPYPPTPSDFLDSASCNDSLIVNDPSETVIEASSQNNEQSPLLSSSNINGSGLRSLKYQSRA